VATANERRRAYEVGFRQEPVPDWIDNADLLEYFDRGHRDADLPADEREGLGARSSSSSSSSRAGGTSTRTRTRPATSTGGSSPSSSSGGSSPSSSSSSSGPRVGEGQTPLPSLGDVNGSARLGGGVTVDDGAGFLLGLFVFALVRCFLQGGTAEARQWLGAKFLNHTSKGAAGTGAGSSTSNANVTAADYPINQSPVPVKSYPQTPWAPTAPAGPSTAATAPLVPGNFGGG